MSDSRRRVRARRKLKGAAVTGSLLAAAVITITAPPAAAATGITSPSAGATITNGSSVTIKAQVDGLLSSGKLMLRRPNQDSFTVVDRGSGTLSHRLDIAGNRPAPNGTYTVRLKTSTLVLPGSQGKRTFKVRIPARQPTGLSAKARSPHQVRLQWSRGPEPDLHSYDVLTSGGRVLRGGLSADGICGASLCTTTVKPPAGSAGQTIGLAVRARRSIAPGSSNTAASPPSQAATVTLAALPNPSPGVTSSGVSPSPTASAGVNGGSASPHPRLEPLSSESSSPTGLPPIGAQGTPGSPSFSAPLPEFPSAGPGGGEASGPGGPTTNWTAVTSSAQRLKTVALVLILLLVAAHLGGLRWRSRSHPTRGGFGAGRGGTPVLSSAGAAGGTGGGRRGTRSPRRARSTGGAYHGRRRKRSD